MWRGEGGPRQGRRDPGGKGSVACLGAPWQSRENQGLGSTEEDLLREGWGAQGRRYVGGSPSDVFSPRTGQSFLGATCGKACRHVSGEVSGEDGPVLRGAAEGAGVLHPA